MITDTDHIYFGHTVQLDSIKTPQKTYFRYTDRFSFLKPGQVIHVVVDQLGDEVAHKAKAVNGVDW